MLRFLSPRGPLVMTALLANAWPAHAHHGVAAVSIAGPEGPGAAIDTTSAIPLSQRRLLVLLKTEYVPFEHRAFADPENKAYSSFNTLVVGYGVTSWLAAYVFQPFNSKSQDTVGTNTGLGDTSFMLTLGLKYDAGLKLLPEKESLDDLEDWHFLFSISSTLPVGNVGRKNSQGEYFAPDMQTGFGEPAPGIGLAVLKLLTPNLTFMAEANYQHFFPHRYAFTRYTFGGETRVNTAIAWRAVGNTTFRLDVVGELNGLHLQRDQEENAGGRTEALTASGGAMVYVGGGVRLFWRSLSAVLGIKRAVLKSLNEAGDQQGSEGLELFRATASVGWSTRLF